MNYPTNEISRNGWFKETQSQPVQNENINFAKMVDRSLKTKRANADINDDEEVYERIKETLRPQETTGEWYSRVGLGRAQLLQMTKREIREFVAIVSQNEDCPVPQDFLIPETKKQAVGPRYVMLD